MKSSLLPGTLAGLALAFAASAHTPYLAPNTFAARAGGVVTMDASFAETFFVPEAVFDASRFSITGPDGYSAAPDTLHTLKTRVVIEHTLPQAKGTYRFSTGRRLGALFRVWEIDGKRESSRDPDVKIPVGATIVSDFQSLTLAETYVSIDAPDRAALAPRGEGLEFVAIDHPGDLYVGERFRFIVQYDGTPLADQKVEIAEAVWTSDRTPRTETLLTDKNGQIALELREPGTWLALTRHRTQAAPGSATAEISNSYTLTFRVLEQ